MQTRALLLIALDTTLQLLLLLLQMIDAGSFNLCGLRRLIRLLMKTVPFILPLLQRLLSL